MSEFVEKVKELFKPEEGEAAQHAVEDGPVRGWAAADVDPSEYVDDDWVKENTKEV